MLPRSLFRRALAFVGLLICVLILTAWIGTCRRGIGHIWADGNAFYVGNGAVEYGYGWGWIRRRAYLPGVPPLGWSSWPVVSAPYPAWRTTPPVQVLFSDVFMLMLCLTVLVVRIETLWRWRPRPFPAAGPLAVSVALAIPTARLSVGVSAGNVVFAFPLASLVCLYAVYRFTPRRRTGQANSDVCVSCGRRFPAAVPHCTSCDEPRARCMECSYDLTGNMSGVCPECGTSIDGRSTPT